MNDKQRVMVNAYLMGGQSLLNDVAKKNKWKPVTKQRVFQILKQVGIENKGASCRNIERAKSKEDLILQMYEAGYTIQEISQNLLVTQSGIKYILLQHKSKIKAINRIRDKRRLPVSVEEGIAQDLKNGMGLTEISRRRGVSVMTVYRIRKQLSTNT